MACGILVPWPGTELVPPAVEAWSPNHWISREVPGLYLNMGDKSGPEAKYRTVKDNLNIQIKLDI